MFATQPIYNAWRAVNALRSDQNNVWGKGRNKIYHWQKQFFLRNLSWVEGKLCLTYLYWKWKQNQQDTLKDVIDDWKNMENMEDHIISCQIRYCQYFSHKFTVQLLHAPTFPAWVWFSCCDNLFINLKSFLHDLLQSWTAER